MLDLKIEIENDLIEYNIQYGKGKKLVINMDSIGFITVKAPNGTSKEVIEDSIKQHNKIIREKLDQIAKKNQAPSQQTYDDKGKFLHLGKEYLLHELIEIDGKEEEELRTNLKKFYITSCKKIVSQRMKIYQPLMGVKAKSFEVDESRTKWGTCNSSKNMTFNYKLAMAPLEAIDYVIVHELCHISHMNHDRSFWRLVGSILPDYKKRQDLLSKLQL